MVMGGLDLSRVVPAKAGTHTPRPIEWATVDATTSHNHKSLWLWVP